MLKTRVTAAVIQLSAGEDADVNCEQAERLVRRAAGKGAGLILLPECFVYRGARVIDHGRVQTIRGPLVRRFQALAKDLETRILLGSVYEKSPSPDKVYNTAVFIDSDGAVTGLYRKRHLFRAKVSGKVIQEADLFLPGKRQKIYAVGAFTAGSAVCYDLRFPELFQSYARQGCDLFFVPSNFTYETGQAHWEVLLRARAIESRCYVLAPNQYGAGGSGVPSYGNSMIIDPWGRILKRAGDSKDAILLWTLDQKEVAAARARLP